MLRQAFEVEHLCSCGGERLQQPRLAAAGAAAHDAQRQPRRQQVELLDDSAAKRLVAAFEHVAAKADLVEEPGERARALAAAPAVDQRPPLARFVERLAFEVRRDVARDHCRADLARLEVGDLAVLGADNAPLVVAQHRPVDGAGQVVLRVLALAARVDHGVEPVELRHGVPGGDAYEAHVAIGASTSSSSLSIASCRRLCCSSGPSTRKVSSTRSPSVVILASCRLMRWRASTRAMA